MDATEKDPMKMTIGPDLDAVAAERVMGACAHRETERYVIEDGNSVDSGWECKACRKEACGPAPYSRKWDSAWLVVLKMRELGYLLCLSECDDAWLVTFADSGQIMPGAQTASPTLSICLGAIAALDRRDDDNRSR